MVINGYELLLKAPIKDMESSKIKRFGVSFGLGEAGYDIRIKQEVLFDGDYVYVNGEEQPDNKFCLASAFEEFDMPKDLIGIVHDKSTWARQGLSVFNTVIECGWKGFLTLELVYHKNSRLLIPAGAGIAQVVFHQVSCEAQYTGKYQGQENEPVPARKSV